MVFSDFADSVDLKRIKKISQKARELYDRRGKTCRSFDFDTWN